MSKPKAATPEEYIAQLAEPRRTAITLIHAMITKAAPLLKPSIQYGMIGYGIRSVEYAGGRIGEAPAIALASQSSYISLHGCGAENLKELKAQLPKADFGKGCIRFRKIEDIDIKILEKVVRTAAKRKAVKAGAGK